MSLSSEFLPHSICLALDPWLVGLHALSDLIAAVSYYFIPVIIILFARKRRDLEYRWALWLSAAFVLACGTTHLLSIVTLWKPVYVLQGYAKAATAAISLASAIAFWAVLPKLLALPSPADLKREIEERRRAEDRLREMNANLEEMVSKRTLALEVAKAEAEQANQAKSRFLAAASHDLRQPVQAMRLLLELSLRKIDEPAILKGLWGRMGEALDSTEVMLASLMEFAALESGPVAVQPEIFRLDEMLHRLVSEQASQAAGKKLQLRVHAVPTAVESDPVLLERVVKSLLLNAVRYTNQGGVLLGIRRHGGKVRIEVRDTGIGIPADKQQEIFEEFCQLGNPARDRAKGTGLGLTIASRAAALLGCALEVVSLEGKGSLFAVNLPQAPLPCLDSDRPRRKPAGKKGPILVVEDDAVQTMALKMILGETGHEVLTAHDLASAITLVKEGASPDLMLCDYRLPGGVAGTAVIQEVRRALGRQVPAIVLTGDTQAGVASEAKAVGAAILHKPYTIPELMELIGEGYMEKAST